MKYLSIKRLKIIKLKIHAAATLLWLDFGPVHPPFWHANIHYFKPLNPMLIRQISIKVVSDG